MWKPVLFCLLITSLHPLVYAQSRDLPNILLIMADDLGAENLACYGNTIYSTPHLDTLAAEGAHFENAYASPVCTPTRAMILTGMHPNRTGFLERLVSPADIERKNRLPVHLKTLGHLFQSAGYATAIAGKWHLGDFQKYPDQPTSHGFDEYSLWAHYWDGVGRSRYFAPHNWENGRYTVYTEEVFGPDHYSEFLMDFMARSRQKGQPFFAYYPMVLIHTPFVIPPGSQESAEVNYPPDLGENERINGYMVHYMDQIVGRLLSKLKDLGIEENTLVIFTGDNGTTESVINRMGDFHLRGGKRTMNEAGTRVPLIAQWPGRIPPGKRESIISLIDILPTLASVSGIPVEHEVDGMDLSHTFFNHPGEDRKLFYMAFEGQVYMVRDKRFRLHEDGRLYDVPVTSNESRYGMDAITDLKAHANDSQFLEEKLEAFMSIQKTDTSYTIIPFGTHGDKFKNNQDKATPKQ